ncbi:BolA/IbaG family iron-sulfur metabolism protein [Buchnera aphidicola]|uniref:BolA/IbaG family iron-sulfur metabolism protein n=1 Tax=Buchnera aphidicola TaxID=9 RepID=UPI003464D810
MKYINVQKENEYYKIIAVGEIFLNKNEVHKQKMIYSHLLKYIKNNKIHAISIKTYSTKEWKKINNKKQLS